MPRAVAPNTCRTCLKRKIKCDGTLPTCIKCQRRGLYCDRSTILRIREYSIPTPSSIGADDDPRAHLEDATTAQLFHLYIKELAPWYDLNDSDHSSFGSIAPAAALSSPLLFAAIVAFAGTYASRKYMVPVSISERYHNRCLQLLISLSPGDETVSNGIALAATCLLRSYEILSEKNDPNRHLFGASTLLPEIPRLGAHGLQACGFWNYLREDITYSLVHECPLKVQLGQSSCDPITDDDFANHITLLLAWLINSYFGKSSIDVAAAVRTWRGRFRPQAFSRCESDHFPAIRMLKDCHVAAMHYYHVAMCMIQPDVRPSSATEICGLAMSAESDAVIVNAYGPICFSGRWLTQDLQRQTLISWLQATQKKTAWTVEVLVLKLQRFWQADASTVSTTS